jgi:hypothetical protein
MMYSPKQPGAGDLPALRRVVSRLAERSGVDLTHPPTLRALIDGELSCDSTGTRQAIADLRSALILLYRLQDSSSEDLGVQGLQRLWHAHQEFVARYGDS